MANGDRIKILIVDDDPNLRRTLSDILRTRGYEALAAKDGGEGLSMMKEDAFDLVLIDLKLPDMRGLEVLEKIKAECPSAEAIIVTGHATLEAAIEATNKGVFSFVRKPYDVDQLLLNVRRALEKQKAKRELLRQLDEMERLNKLMVDRELKMEEMKTRIKDLEAQLARLSGQERAAVKERENTA